MKYFAILIVLVILGVIAYRKHWFGLGLSGTKVKSTGADPNPADCGGIQRTSSSATSFATAAACTAPLYATGKIAISSGVKQVNERCFTLDEIGGIEPDQSTTIRLPYPYNNATWSFNRQMGEKYCFVDSTQFPCTTFDCSK